MKQSPTKTGASEADEVFVLRFWREAGRGADGEIVWRAEVTRLGDTRGNDQRVAVQGVEGALRVVASLLDGTSQ
ncbi:hypothetical protein MesoLjLb_75870 [Mesorhizobium sp. L-8-3]|nr:hypothetical protein MesoLjLb_75870 [Mesorhizobium sp. L-8-3]